MQGFLSWTPVKVYYDSTLLVTEFANVLDLTSFFFLIIIIHQWNSVMGNIDKDHLYSLFIGCFCYQESKILL